MAGKRKATEDERWLFDIIADGISIMRPGMLFAENVEGLLSAKMPDGSSVFGHCVERLERLHYKVEAGIFSAAEVGAPHQRKRVFILAYDQSQRIQGHWADWLQESRPHAGQGLPLRGGDAGGGELANTLCNGSGEGWLIRQGADGAESVSNGESWGAWPSRPGQPQHAWEPPRVVDNSKYDGLTSCQIGGSTCETIPEQQIGKDNSLNIERAGSIATTKSDGMGYTQSRENNGRESRDMDEASSQWGCCDDAVDCTSESMGDSECIRLQGWGEQTAMGEKGFIPIGEGCESSSSTQEPINTGEQEGSWRDESECSKIEQPMGYSTHGTESWLGISELSGLSDSELAEIREWMVKTDNRTDELRLLGNGCVPATVSRAFLTLLNKLNNE